MLICTLCVKTKFFTYSFALLDWWCLLVACLFSFVRDAYIKRTLTKTKQKQTTCKMLDYLYQSELYYSSCCRCCCLFLSFFPPLTITCEFASTATSLKCIARSAVKAAVRRSPTHTSCREAKPRSSTMVSCSGCCDSQLVTLLTSVLFT